MNGMNEWNGIDASNGMEWMDHFIEWIWFGLNEWD